MSDTIFKIALKSKVKDSITSFRGSVVGRTQFLYGCVRYAVQSEKLEEGKPGAPHWFDEDQLTVIKAEIEGGSNFKFNLGDEVKDTLTPFQGVITGRSEMIFNSPPRYGVQSKELYKGIPTQPEWMDEQQITLVKKAKVEKPKTAATKAPGGPRPDAQRRPDYRR